jgi:hypothetical protein
VGALLRRVGVAGAAAVLLLGAGAGRAHADRGPWQWPLAGEPVVSRGFAPPAVRYGAGHRGVDLAAAPGAAVRAAGAGRVSYAGLLAGRGVVVVVHGALRTTYEPVSAAVAVGEVVDDGEVVGRLEAGHAGCPVQACLHWGLRRGEDYLDPLLLVQRGPARLLPLGDAGPAAGSGRGAAGSDGGPVRGASAPVGSYPVADPSRTAVRVPAPVRREWPEGAAVPAAAAGPAAQPAGTGPAVPRAGTAPSVPAAKTAAATLPAWTTSAAPVAATAGAAAPAAGTAPAVLLTVGAAAVLAAGARRRARG